MEQKYINIYQSCRNTAGITQERAAELVGVSVESIRDYEGGKRLPPNHIVAKMIEIYGTPYLAIQHINLSAKDLSAYLPEVTVTDLPQAVLRLQKELNDFIKCKDELIDITYDNVIGDDERPRFDAILKEMEDVASAIMSLKFYRR